MAKAVPVKSPDDEDDDDMEGVPPLTGFKDTSLSGGDAGRGGPAGAGRQLARHMSHIKGPDASPVSPRQSFVARMGSGGLGSQHQLPERSSTSLPTNAATAAAGGSRCDVLWKHNS